MSAASRAVTSTLAYKKKNKPGVARILSQSLDVVVQATPPRARAAEISVAPAPPK